MDASNARAEGAWAGDRGDAEVAEAADLDSDSAGAGRPSGAASSSAPAPPPKAKPKSGPKRATRRPKKHGVGWFLAGTKLQSGGVREPRASDAAKEASQSRGQWQ